MFKSNKINLKKEDNFLQKILILSAKKTIIQSLVAIFFTIISIVFFHGSGQAYIKQLHFLWSFIIFFIIVIIVAVISPLILFLINLYFLQNRKKELSKVNKMLYIKLQYKNKKEAIFGKFRIPLPKQKAKVIKPKKGKGSYKRHPKYPPKYDLD